MSIISLALDLIIAAIVLFCAWRGFKSGIIVSICGVVAILIAICAGNVVSKVYSGEISGMLKTFGAGIIDTATSEAMEYTGEDGEDHYVVLGDKDKEDVEAVSYATLLKVGIADSAAKDIASDTGENATEVNQNMRTVMTENLCAKMAYLIVFVIVFALVAIIFAAVGNVVNLSFSIPGIKITDNIVGAAIGFIKGIMIVLVITCALRYFGIILGASAIHKTVITEWLVNSNIIANILGI